jgi:hypothetical protein
MKLHSLLVLCFAILATTRLFAQQDSLPRFAIGQLDWVKLAASAPKFQQKDLTVRIVRLNGLTPLYEQETSAAWQNDWHFVYLNPDRLLDGIYCGQTKQYKGWSTLIALGDSAFNYPLTMRLDGYACSLRQDSTGMELLTRRDPGDKEYLCDITHHYYSFKSRMSQSLWQLRFVSSTEIPVLGPQPDRHKLRQSTQMRTSPRQLSEPAIDYDQDGRADAAGNVVAEFAAGARLDRYAIVREGDLEWSFVVIYGMPLAGSVLKASDHPKAAYAGWIPSGAFLK